MDGNLAYKPKAAEPASQPKPNLREQVQSLRLPEEDEWSGSIRRWLVRLFWLALLAALGAGGYFGYRALNPPEQPIAQAPESNPPKINAEPSRPVASSPASPAGVTAAVASSGDIALESKGYIIPVHKILVSPKVSGMLLSLPIEEGQRVKKGEVLGQIETVEYDADYKRAQASVAAAGQRLLELERGFRKDEIAQAKAEFEEAQALRSQLYAEWQRITQLRRSGVATPSEYDLAEANYKTIDRRLERLHKAYDLMVEGPRIERIDTARADLALAQAEQTKAKWRLDNCQILAPISGTILNKNSEAGNLVNPIAQQGNFSLCEMADLSDLEVDLNIQERDISKIFKGQKCKVRAEAWPERVYDGYVSRLMPMANRSQAAVPVRVKISVPSEEEGVYLKPEMGAVVSFLKGDSAAK